jgi:hydrogenase expression/formation protein HypE
MTEARQKTERIALAHGGGGQLTDDLVSQSVMPKLGNAALADLLDSGVIGPVSGKIALTIDGYVVQPLKFPGGDIGRLAVSGTVNDLAVVGARPLGLALSLILEEGLERAVLEEVMASIAQTAAEANVKVITGDTKVVGRGQADGMYITTAGVGVMRDGCRLHPDEVRAGDVLIINGPVADHGLAVMLAREMPTMKSVLRSDAAPLNGLIARVLDSGAQVSFMRDATRGGLAGVAADLAARTKLRIVLEEEAIGVRAETQHAADMLGLDVLEVANEGKVVIVARPESADKVLSALRADGLGREARVIGRVEEANDGLCEIHTSIGGRRILQKPYGEQLPRIC